MKPLSDQVVGEANQLIGKEGMGSGDYAAAARFGGEAARYFRAAGIEREAKQCDRLSLEVLVRKRRELFGKPAAVDNRAPVGDQREAGRLLHQPSAASRFSA